LVNVKNESGIEAFYDFTLTPAIRLIPSYQHSWELFVCPGRDEGARGEFLTEPHDRRLVRLRFAGREHLLKCVRWHSEPTASGEMATTVTQNLTVLATVHAMPGALCAGFEYYRPLPI
jgi:hypothetical protein